MTNNELFIKPLINKITDLEQRGFKNSGNMRIKGGNQLQDWTRYSGWKQERIQLHYPSRAPEWCEITFWIYLVIEHQPYLLMAEDIGQLKNSKHQYRFPSVLKGVRSKAVIEKIVTDVISSLYWFDEKNKQECLKLIDSDDENVVIKSTKPIYPKAVELLKQP